mgnify:CR=1 FL=1
MPKYGIITESRSLAAVCDALEGEKEIAFDLEADSLHHYREKVCLLQVSDRENTWLIDPLAFNDLSPLGGILASKGRLTVFHGGDYDIRSLYRDFGITVASMFDTMIAAQFCGVTEFGLAALLRENFGIELDKRFQKADWSRRPLTAEMADYAAKDTAYLLGLSDRLRQRLEQLGRLAWVEEECAMVASARMAEKGEGPLFLNCKGAGRLDRRSLAVLEELLQFRDKEAQTLDRPPFKVISSETLIILAEKQPKSVHEMNGVSGLTPKLQERYGSRLLAAVQRGMALSPESLPRFPRGRGEPNPGIKGRLARLRQWREGISRELNLAPGLVAPNWLLERVAEQMPKAVEPLSQVQGIRRWQLSLWGEELLKQLTKESH